MLLKTITFDEKNPAWVKDEEFNMMFLRHTETHMNNLIMGRGYVYLNEICEALGSRWDPKDENPCIYENVIGKPVFIHFEIFGNHNNSFVVRIHRWD